MHTIPDEQGELDVTRVLRYLKEKAATYSDVLALSTVCDTMRMTDEDKVVYACLHFKLKSGNPEFDMREVEAYERKRGARPHIRRLYSDRKYRTAATEFYLTNIAPRMDGKRGVVEFISAAWNNA